MIFLCEPYFLPIISFKLWEQISIKSLIAVMTSWNFIDCRTHFLSEKSFSKPLYYLIQIEIQREREREYKECEMFKNPSGMN